MNDYLIKMNPMDIWMLSELTQFKLNYIRGIHHNIFLEVKMLSLVIDGLLILQDKSQQYDGPFDLLFSHSDKLIYQIMLMLCDKSNCKIHHYEHGHMSRMHIPNKIDMNKLWQKVRNLMQTTYWKPIAL